MAINRFIPLLLIVIGVFFFTLCFYIDGQKITDFSSAAFLPAVVAILMIICSLLIAKRGVAAPTATINVPEREEESLVEIENITKKQLNIRLLLFLLSVVLFAYLMNYLNFLIVSFLFLFLIMFILNRQKLITSFIISITMSVFFYYLFATVFKIVFPA